MEGLTMKQLAQKVGIPESTARAWRDTFPEFIPFEGKGRKRRYSENAALVLRSIAELKERNETQETINAELARLYPVSVEARTQERSNAAETQELTTRARDDRTVLVALVREVLDSKADKADLADLMNRIEAAERTRTQENADLTARVESLANTDIAKELAELKRKNATLTQAVRTLDVRTRRPKDTSIAARLRRAWAVLKGE